ncbi:type II toxin-antitoxin system death-on-curing family toxin [Pediococcus damnosus]|uniref:type II toxin-antitoxin system death-on-curing family toxin n=1 Tax=Pediococcus damnosus TaxID=51663 RepID=UPI00061F1785|nr:type II toxin-antitoxin system death-on-curing family toxin [Pediococcus damnosus]KJU74823.1 phage killer protein [Pediococcus damnosus LMG 28219]PIO82058.1 death-on-curing family protein [Pediococcus damnosus]PIO86227.1 death-on-curing family protein [Pediococcus damnosus]PJE50283.1 type II toxin-antitoxin system death-on-curing family toxin [Pediococcus damnosus]
MKYLSKSDLIEINKYAVQMTGGTNFGVQSYEALDVIANQPGQIVFGHELYPTIWLKAAFILQKITKKHVFVDGNKRTALFAALRFLNDNNYVVKDDSVINNSGSLVLAVTNSSDDEKTMQEIAHWLKINHYHKD